MKINPLFVILLLLCSIISLNWYLNIDMEYYDIVKDKEYLNQSQIISLQQKGVVKKHLNSSDGRIYRVRDITYYKTKSNIPFIWDKDTISEEEWDYKREID